MTTLTRAYEGCYWTTEDAAGMWLNESGPEPPTHVKAFRIGSVSLVVPPTIHVPISRLTLLCVGTFGEGRGGRTKWTGDAYKFAVYIYTEPVGLERDRERVVILRHDGSGTKAYYLDELWSVETWKCLALLSPEMLWNILHTLTDTFYRGQAEASGRYVSAILEKRVKVNRRGRRHSVEIVPKVARHSAACIAANDASARELCICKDNPPE